MRRLRKRYGKRTYHMFIREVAAPYDIQAKTLSDAKSRMFWNVRAMPRAVIW